MLEILAITQARTSSTRLPGKVLKKIEGQSLLDIHLKRLSKSKLISKLIVATTNEIADQAIVDICKQGGVDVYRGSLNNLLDRIYQAALIYKPRLIVRITSDCPLIDAKLVDDVIEQMKNLDVDYCSNMLESGFPNGQDIEVFTFSALEKAWKEASSDYDKEHVTPYIYNNSDFYGGTLFSASAYKAESQIYADVRITVDTEKDFEVIEKLIKKLGWNNDWKSYANFYLKEAQEDRISKS